MDRQNISPSVIINCFFIINNKKSFLVSGASLKHKEDSLRRTLEYVR